MVLFNRKVGVKCFTNENGSILYLIPDQNKKSIIRKI